MALALTRWPTMTSAEKLLDCANLTTVRPPADSPAPTPVNVLFSVRAGLFQRGETVALPPAEAAAVIAAGFATAA
jgi:hypothetical protein